MAELLDPAAVGVASTLKSLRTRAGLREDRLSDTELALGTLTALASVRALMDAGEPTERAIVRAVCAAAGVLDPTMSIVADVSLGLELSASLVNDADLYAKDLGMRRKALLKNWDRLHQVRSVAPAKLPSPRALRLEVEIQALAALATALTRGSQPVSPPPVGLPGKGNEASVQAGATAPLPGRAEMQVLGTALREALGMRGVSAEDVARQLSVPPVQVSRWVEGRELPAERDARALDDYLTARGAIANLVLGIGSQPTLPRPALTPVRLAASEPAMTMLGVFRRVAAALRGRLTLSERGIPLGWPHDLQQPPERVTSVSTAFALRTLVLLEGHLAPDLVPVVENLRSMSSREGGYRTREQAGPRPEITASVLCALHMVDGTADFTEEIGHLLRDLRDFEKSRPFILTTMLEASLRLNGSGHLTEQLIESLLTARRPSGNLLLWPEKSDPLLIDPAPSVAHTARAVRALSAARGVGPDDRVNEAVDQAVAWLLEQRDFSNTGDVIDRPLHDGGGRVESVFTRHFTAAWVARALISAGVPASHPTVSTAVSQIWDSYAGNAAALWKWDNGDLPSWMTFDAIDALWLACLAAPAPLAR
jgi:transcriptional regulator with XRE-family HTH domain